MKTKVVKRRKPTTDNNTETVVEAVVGACPSCPHKVEDHNQFGCCSTEDVCYCLMTPASIAAAQEEHVQGI